MEITEETPIKIVKGDTLTMEFVPLPVVTTAYRFLYRFSTPMDTIWVEGQMSYFKSQNMTLQGRLEQFAESAWRDLVLSNGYGDENDLPAEAKWLLQMTKIKVIENKIVRK